MSRGKGLFVFALTLILIVIARILIGTITVPTAWIPAANVAVSFLFVAAPIYGMFAAAADIGRVQGSHRWAIPIAALVIGAATQFLMSRLVPGMQGRPQFQGIVVALGQTGLLLWCFGLGACLAEAVRDKNMLLPIALFLAIFDLWLVFSPMGTVNVVLAEGGQRLKDLAYQVPEVAARSRGGLAQALAYVGPADYLFLAMFFTALFRFRMRTRAALIAMSVVLPLYLFFVLATGVAMPALVPIGAVILLTNAREFRLARDEKVVTWAIAILGAIFLIYSVFFYKAPTLEKEAPRPSPSYIQA